MPFTPFVAAPLAGWTLAVVLLLSVTPVWRWGSSGERECVLALVFALVLDLGIQLLAPIAPASLAHAASNLLALTLLTRSALHSARIYPLVMAAAQLIAVITHGLFWLGLSSAKVSYPIIVTAMDSATIAALWIGSAQNRLWPNRRN